MRHLGACVADEDIELLELLLDLAEHLLDLIGAQHIGLHDESVGIASADFGKRLIGGTLVLEIMDGDLRSLLRQLQRDSSTDTAGASSDQGVFGVAGIWTS